MTWQYTASVVSLVYDFVCVCVCAAQSLSPFLILADMFSEFIQKPTS